jgi:hypothetical protein
VTCHRVGCFASAPRSAVLAGMLQLHRPFEPSWRTAGWLYDTTATGLAAYAPATARTAEGAPIRGPTGQVYEQRPLRQSLHTLASLRQLVGRLEGRQPWPGPRRTSGRRCRRALSCSSDVLSARLVHVLSPPPNARLGRGRWRSRLRC